jgi:hypothetical protein
MMQPRQSADVVNMSVSADDGPHRQFVSAQQIKDALDLVSGVDHNGFPRDRVSDDRTVALQHAHGKLDVDHFRLGGVWHALGSRRFAHSIEYTTPVSTSFR